MLIKILVRFFGGMWNLKALCNSATNTVYKKILIGIYKAYQGMNGCSIAWNSDLAGVPCLPHGLHGIFISATSKIGKNCVIFQQVTIGANILPDSKSAGSPTIGDNCYIGAGAKIIGHIKVGNNVRIGANCVVYDDVDDNCIVVSSGQTVIKRDRPVVNRFYRYDKKWLYYDDGKWIEEKSEDYKRNIDFCKKAYET
jgi:serine O-acetyltransferase